MQWETRTVGERRATVTSKVSKTEQKWSLVGRAFQLVDTILCAYIACTNLFFFYVHRLYWNSFFLISHFRCSWKYIWIPNRNNKHKKTQERNIQILIWMTVTVTMATLDASKLWSIQVSANKEVLISLNGFITLHIHRYKILIGGALMIACIISQPSAPFHLHISLRYNIWKLLSYSNTRGTHSLNSLRLWWLSVMPTWLEDAKQLIVPARSLSPSAHLHLLICPP